MAATKTRSQGKSAFIKEVLFDNPRANAKTVNEAWKAAGMEGTISESLVKVLRSELGLAGNLRATGKRSAGRAATKTPKAKPATKPKKGPKKKKTAKARANARSVTPTAMRQPRSNDRNRVLADIETDIDTLIFKLMKVGGMERVEDALRAVRRVVVRGHEA
jgi:hypothetical protein